MTGQTFVAACTNALNHGVDEFVPEGEELDVFVLERDAWTERHQAPDALLHELRVFREESAAEGQIVNTRDLGILLDDSAKFMQGDDHKAPNGVAAKTSLALEEGGDLVLPVGLGVHDQVCELALRLTRIADPRVEDLVQVRERFAPLLPRTLRRHA